MRTIRAKLSRVVIGAAIITAMALGGGDIAIATTPTSDVVYACVNPGGSWRYLNYAGGERCKAQETQVSWNVTGEPGAKGDKGDPGPVGPAGADGAPGADGEPGADGAPGPVGPQGPGGPTGPVAMRWRGDFVESWFGTPITYQKGDVVRAYSGLWWATDNVGYWCFDEGTACQNDRPNRDVPWVMLVRDGRDGDQGADGRDGTDGRNGIDGQIGPAGPTGPAGPKGDKGDTGPQGPPGPAGPATLPRTIVVDTGQYTELKWNQLTVVASLALPPGRWRVSVDLEAQNWANFVGQSNNRLLRCVIDPTRSRRAYLNSNDWIAMSFSRVIQVTEQAMLDLSCEAESGGTQQFNGQAAQLTLMYPYVAATQVS